MEATIRASVSWMVRNSQGGGVGDTLPATEGNVKEAATVKISTKVKTTRNRITIWSGPTTSGYILIGT